MGFWKVLGGVAAGVSAVVALPVAGPIGAVTLIGAAIGGSAVGLAGKLMSALDEDEIEAARASGERVTTAKYEQKVEKLVSSLKKAGKTLSDDKSYFELLIALFAVGLATANADGKVSEEELDDLNEFCGGIANSHFPPHVKSIIAQLKNNPPSFNTAMQYVRKLGDNIDIKLFESVIEVVSASDGCVSDEEKALLTAFRKAAA